jgi:hypothetical protein
VLRAGATARVEDAARLLVTLALPLTASRLLASARALHAAREAARAVAAAWEQERQRALAEWSRRNAALESEERERARLEAEHASTLRRLHALRERATLAERWGEEAGAAEAAELERACGAVTSALELDRYAYLRHAGGGRRAQPRAAAPRREAERNLGLAG